uniref:Pre-mRNA cleavage complex 2 protein Pcf11 n=1 Tax=Pogona vitticeps TaxID=103695 RepID=A0A6J0UT11_9SAUR
MSGDGSSGSSASSTTAAASTATSTTTAASAASEGGGGGSEDACRDYQSSLEDLTFNSKPHINMLTILAEENVPFAKDIVSLIEAQIAKAPSNEKLPVMYLMDSIVKNVGREYLAAFTKNLVATFVNVFEKVDENTRKSLFKLRSTWDEIFPLKKLYALDVRVNSVDPAWPIKPLPPNVNTSSIHVNPKFLNKSPEEPPAPSPAICSPPVSCSTVSSTPVVPEMQKNLTQEQLIRQQLLAKQKQLLELQQKKLELELEQTKAQLAVSLSVQQSGPGVGQASLKQHVPQPPHMPIKTPNQVGLPPEKKRLSPPQDVKVPNRDPRLNRTGQYSSHSKDQSHRKDFIINPVRHPDPKASKTLQAERQNVSKQEKQKQSEKSQKFDQFDSKSKSPSPLQNRPLHAKEARNQECENTRVSEISKRDPRLKKHLLEKPDGRDDDIKEKRRSMERKEEHRSIGGRSKMINGIVQKHDLSTEEPEKQGGKLGRSSTRKRSRSPRSRSPSSHSPKRRERRSPKRRLRSLSPGSKIGKPRQSGPKQSHTEEFGPGTRDERTSNKRSLKQEVRDSRRLKKTHEDRLQEGTNQHSSKAASEPKENVENWQGSKSSKRWKSGWEENKNPQLADEHQGLCKSPHQRHRETWASSKGVPSPRALKQQHRLSVDANLQIPKELTLANKRELLKKANERLSSGEITQDDFLVLCHKIHQLFQYQEGKHRYNVRDSPTGEKGISKKKPLLSESDLIYHEHKAKLKRTQVQHSFPRLNMVDAEEMLDYHLKDTFLSGMDCEQTKSKCGSQFGERSRRHSPVGGRLYSDNAPHDGRRRHDEASSSKGVREEQRPQFNEHYKRTRYEDTEKPFTESSGSRFGVSEGKQRFSSLMEDRPHFESSPRNPGTRTGGEGQASHFEGPAPTNSRIEGPQPQTNLRFEGSLSQPSKYDGPPGKSGGKGSLIFDGPPAQMGSGSLRFDGPSGVGNAMHFEGPIGQPGGTLRFDGPTGQSMGGIRFENLHGQPKGGMRFEGPHVQPASGIRFEAPHGQSSAGVRFEGPLDQPSGSMRFDGQPSGGMRFEGPHGQLSSGIRFEGPHDRPVGPHGPPGGGMRFEGPHGQPIGPHGQPGAGLRFEGPHMQPMGPLGQPGGNLRFEAPHGQPMGPRGQPAGGLRFEGPHGQPGIAPRFEGPHGQPGIGSRFEGPSVQSAGGLRFEGPINQTGPRFDGCPSRFDGQPGQPSLLQRLDGLHVQAGPRFEMGPSQPGPRFDGPSGQQVQSRFDTPISQRFEDQATRFDLPLGHQGQRIENLSNHPSRLETPPYGQTGPYNEPPNQPPYNGPSQGMPFQRPEPIFENPQGPNFNGLPVAGAQGFPNALNRAPGAFYDDKNLQGPQYGNFNNITVGNIQPPQQVPVMSVAAAQPVPYSQGQPLLPVQAQNPGSFVQNQPGNVPLSYPDNHLGQLDVNELYSKLLSTGILKVLQSDSTSAQVNEVSTQPAPEEEEEDQDQNEDQDVPDLTNFVIEELKQRYDSVINRLYTGIQCYSCGMRFTTSQTDVYADHLDWHYRQNRTEKDVSRKVTHRRWYYSLTDWIEFEEIADLEERAKSQFFEKVHEEVVLKTQEAAKEKEFQSVPAGPAGVDESCEICQEQFEQYWDEEEEEWHLKNAIRVDEKIYHPSCYEDYQKTSSFDSTPSPSKTPVENPLNIMLNIVKQEVQDSCNSPKVEEKPDECMEENTPASAEIKTEPEKVESV